ncbi:hypothetical protein DIU31_009485 [Mucilaginibacter rubeus]|uniref:CHAT domain-containing protein n=1 Tax=Mucilaginibacter rubeus TaxID=2027860 RepID=A0AAE6JDQ6_9SPHI|nr:MULTISPECIES: hypothetical protein [Mucilaginibacter]QEM03733.1 hypothetical protein DIU31_009485 [Mucilaginibacter rubeus]QEM16344.1 hypothetical protein DIU38_009580 [Mucilaginibacter gossypii]QTE40889.1 hypothetical protein J3L19_18175 [Mucilaginibacter rubeus]QTE47492.1 hypothetical protein J3L21_18150 [Mucilaginibacter rubeus]QTE58884.1 hypothetical protein J3L23_09815 [Mucilaginibacter rubeus]
MNLLTTVYGVYIIESLNDGDYFDGENLNGILTVAKIPVIYRYALSVSSLKELLQDFKRSKFRYLYLSCHADEDGIEINGEAISYRELQHMSGNMKDVRIFMSACKGVNRPFAKLMIGKSKILSLIGSPDDIDQDKAAVFWPAFFYIMKESDEKKMVRSNISITLKKLINLFDLPINYYSKITGDPKHMRQLKIRTGKSTDNKKIAI